MMLPDAYATLEAGCGLVRGSMPVQGYGWADGLPWYFRARHRGWEFGLAASYETDPVDVTIDEGANGGFFREGLYDNASHMEEYAAWALIDACIADWRAASRSAV